MRVGRKQQCLGQSKILVMRLTVPVTFAFAERSFSKLKLLKTVMRSVMNQERLGELMTLACERDLTDTIDLDEIANPCSKLTKHGHKNTMFHSKLYVFLQNS
jgi:hypothetical protein